MSETEKLMELLRQNAMGTTEWDKDFQPLVAELTEERKKSLERFIVRPTPKTETDKHLCGLPTGTILDILFLDNNEQPIGGVPVGVQLIILGLPSSGKSILVDEIVLNVINNNAKVLLVLSEDAFRTESARLDRESRMKEKAEIMGVDWSKVIENLYVIDTIIHSDMRVWSDFAETYKKIIETENPKFVIIDNLTLLQNYRGGLKDSLKMLTQYNQQRGVTAFFVSQRGSEDWDGRSMAGGISLGHIADSTVIVDYGDVSGWKPQLKQDVASALGINLKDKEDMKRPEAQLLKQGQRIRIIRCLGCRLCGYDAKYYPATISGNGFLRAVVKKKEKTE